MKNRFFLMLTLIAALGSIILLDSCTEEPIGALGPSTALIAGTDLVTSSAVIPAEGTFAVNLTATSGDAEMNSLTIQKDGVNVDFADLTINGTAASSNAILLFGSDRTALDYAISVKTDLNAGESATYSFLITDDNGNTGSESVDISVDVRMDPPSLSLGGSGNTLTVNPATSFKTTITAVKGTGDLISVTVLEDGVPVDVSRITSIDNGTGSVTIDANPVTVPTENASGFMWDIFVRAADTEKTSIYTFIVTDSNDSTATVTQEIITEIPGTELTSIQTMLQLFNQGGPPGTGGINLKTGQSVGSGDASAHLRDAGIDLAKPAASNWKQQIGPGMATATLKTLSLNNQPEGFSYDGVDTKEAIQAAFDAETNVIGNGEFSASVNPGQMFVLQANDGDYILVRVDEVLVRPNEGDNSDHYLLSVKY